MVAWTPLRTRLPLAEVWVPAVPGLPPPWVFRDSLDCHSFCGATLGQEDLWQRRHWRSPWLRPLESPGALSPRSGPPGAILQMAVPDLPRH